MQSQWWSGYTGTCSDPYTSYAYSQSYAPYGLYGYSGYSTPGSYDYQYPYNAYPDGTQQPIVVVVDGDDDDDNDGWEWIELVSAIASLTDNNGGNNRPIYVPYPIPVSYGNNCDCENYCENDGCSSCGCRNKGCNCKNSDSYYNDYGCNCVSCDKRKKGQSKCCSGNGCSNCGSDCGCNKCSCSNIKHKCDRCRN